MALYSDLPVYKSTYDLLLAIFRFTKEFGKEYKYTVGESLKKETIELLTLIYRANVNPPPLPQASWLVLQHFALQIFSMLTSPLISA
jgi:hypothetical protein